MQEKSRIIELELCWGRQIGNSIVNHEDVLEGLKPNRNVKNLLLKNFGGQRLASWICGDVQFLQNLVEIELLNCFNCEEVPRLGLLPHLKKIEMDGFNNLKRIGPAFYGLDEGIVCAGGSTGAAPAAVFPALRVLILDNIPQLEEWSDTSLPVIGASTMDFFPCLEQLHISNCPKLIRIPGHLPSFQTLSISEDLHRPHSYDSTNNRVFMAELGKSLKNLYIQLNGFFFYLPNQLLGLSSLEKLQIYNCSNLDSLFEDKEAAFDGLTCLQWLSIMDCDKLRCLPKGLLQPSLVTLEITRCPDLEMAHPDELRTLSSLENLRIVECPRLRTCWEEGLFCVTSLKKLVIGSFSEELEYFPWPSSTSSATAATSDEKFPFISLESLTLWGWEKLKYLPDQIRHLTTLGDLKIGSFRGLEALPEWLCNLSSLQTLDIRYCPRLTSSPSLEIIQRLTNLHTLYLHRCPLLIERIREESGEEWPKTYRNVSIKFKIRNEPLYRF